MAEGARLESVYTATYRGFESPPHRHILRRVRTKVRTFFSHVAHIRGDEKPRLGFDNWRQPVGQTANAVNGLPAGRAKRVNPPPHRHILRRVRTKVRAFFRMLHTSGGDEKLRPGFDNWRQPVGQTANAVNGLPAGRAKRVNPPPHRHILRRVRTKVRAFFRMLHTSGGDEKLRPGFDNWRQPVGQTANAVNGLPAGRAKRVNPPLTAIF